jgi:Flp pilus assembly protein TadD
MKTLTHFRLSTVIVVALVSSACSTSQTKREYQPDDQLTAMLKQYNVNQTDGVNCQGYQSAISDCERLSNDLGALSMTYPQHQQIGFTAAIVYHQIGRDVDSQMVLDRLLSQQQPVSEVAILRSKLAMQEGNINLARTVLQRQVQLQPDHPELHATLAASYYLEGR